MTRDVPAERREISDGSDGEREVPRVDRALHTELEALDRGLGASRIGEQAAREDQRARDGRVLLNDRRAPTQRRFALSSEKEGERAVER